MLNTINNQQVIFLFIYNCYMKIGIFGGTFNPVHKGHIQIAQFAIKELGLDKLIFVPTYKSPFKSKEKIIDAEHRVKMLELVKPEKSEISDFEIKRKGTSYTIDTVKYFKQQYPNDELFLLIGTDNVYKLNKWRSINNIVEITQLAIFKRAGNFSRINIKRYKGILLDNNLADFSSTEFKAGALEQVEDVVMKYIADNYLYLPEIMMSMLDKKRHKHSLAVGRLAPEYAKVVGIDAKKAWLTGNLHDITKSWSKEKHREFLEEQGYKESDFKDFQLHSTTGALWVKNVYKLDDEEVYNAILRHTNLAMELSDLDRVVFAADKLCEGRAYDGVQQLRKLMFEDFDAGFKILVKDIRRVITEKSGPVSDEQEEIYKRWM